MDEFPQSPLGCASLSRLHHDRDLDKEGAGHVSPALCYGIGNAAGALWGLYRESRRILDVPGWEESERRLRRIPARQEVPAHGSRHEVLRGVIDHPGAGRCGGGTAAGTFSELESDFGISRRQLCRAYS